MQFKNDKIKKILYTALLGAFFGTVYALIEYYSKLGTDTEEVLIPLLIRASIGGASFFLLIIYSSQILNKRLSQKKFIVALLIKSMVYTAIISVILILVNVVWFLINRQYAFWEQALNYFTDYMYFVNLGTIFPLTLLVIAVGQIGSLHRRGDLLNFVLGRYNTPMEVERVFCFADLKGSTSIAEILGNLQYAAFLKEYYSDITEVVNEAGAQIYQYVGDEIVLSWPYRKALKDNNMFHCVFRMKQVLNNKKQEYMKTYGFVPYFRAGLHGGKVVVSWVGGRRKEIVYIGDVLNTTARIQGECKRLNKNFLVSGNLLDRVEDLGRIKATFIEETVPRGKATKVKLYSLEKKELSDLISSQDMGLQSKRH
jgi:adenylate cyclase